MSIRGTENYIYYSENILGSGSTATVFFGRHKRKGEACAVKLFSNQTTERRKAIKDNELKHMQNLDHKNIVKLLAIEEDSRTKDTALIMELCTEGSVQKLLGNAKYFYGFPESVLVDFIGQLASGLHYLRLHGIGHRDVKPGNILCSLEEDKRMTFKLTDFGASRELLLEGANRTALYGTEEYLHPVVYNAVFIEKRPIRDEHEATCELWSIGTTLYHVATGQQPFQVYGGRNNREKMYEVISGKRSGVISGVQKMAAGDVEYSSNLPKSCFLSLGLTHKLVTLLAGLVEADISRQMQFDRFFPLCKEISENILIIVLNVFRCCYHYCYMPANATYAILVSEISRQMKEEFDGWRITESEELLLFYGSRPLTDQINIESDVNNFPATSMENPIVVLPIPEKVLPEISVPQFTSMPGFPRLERDDKGADASWSLAVSAYTWRAIAVVKSLLQIQTNISKCKSSLIYSIRSKCKTVEERLESSVGELRQLKSKHTALNVWVPIVCEQLSLAVESARKQSGFLKNLTNKVTSDSREISAILSSATGQLHGDIEVLREILESLSSHINLSLSDVRSISITSTGIQPLAKCDEQKCVSTMEVHYEKANLVYEQFIKEKNATLTYNQDQLHKFERVKLEERVRLVTNTVYGHCWTSTLSTRLEFINWYKENAQQPLSTIRGMEKQAIRVNDIIVRLSKTLEMLVSHCESFILPMTSKDVLKTLKGIFSNRELRYGITRLTEKMRDLSVDPVSTGSRAASGLLPAGGIKSESGKESAQSSQSGDATGDADLQKIINKFLDDLIELKESNDTSMRLNEQLGILLRSETFEEFDEGSGVG